MGLRLKFNLVLLLVFLVGLGIAGWISRDLLIRNARDEVARNASLMMEAALAVRGYTITQVRPHLEMQLMRAFLPQTVPAYAAAETMGELRKKYPDYFYKEATLNPTNPRNRAADWEADLVQEFRNRPTVKELGGERDTPTGRARRPPGRGARQAHRSGLFCAASPGPTPGRPHANAISTWSAATEAPGATRISSTTPSRSARSTFSIFIASRIKSS